MITVYILCMCVHLYSIHETLFCNMPIYLITLNIIYCTIYHMRTTERVRRESQHAEVPESAGGGGVGR